MIASKTVQSLAIFDFDACKAIRGACLPEKTKRPQISSLRRQLFGHKCPPSYNVLTSTVDAIGGRSTKDRAMGKRTKKNSPSSRTRAETRSSRSRSEYAAEQRERDSFLDRMNILDPTLRELYARARSSHIDLADILSLADPQEQLAKTQSLIDEKKRSVDRLASLLVPERTSLRPTMRIDSKATKDIFGDRDEVLKVLYILGLIRAENAAKDVEIERIQTEFLAHFARLTELQSKAVKAIDLGPAALARVLELYGHLRAIKGPNGANLIDDLCAFLEQRGHGRPVKNQISDALKELLEASLNAGSHDPDEIPDAHVSAAINGNAENTSDQIQIAEADSPEEANLEQPAPLGDCNNAPEFGSSPPDGVANPSSEYDAVSTDDPLSVRYSTNSKCIENSLAKTSEEASISVETQAGQDPVSSASESIETDEKIAKRGQSRAEIKNEEPAAPQSDSRGSKGQGIPDEPREDFNVASRTTTTDGWIKSHFPRGSRSPSRDAIPARVNERGPVSEITISRLEAGLIDHDIWLEPNFAQTGLRLVQHRGTSRLLPSYDNSVLPPKQTMVGLAGSIEANLFMTERFRFWDGQRREPSVEERGDRDAIATPLEVFDMVRRAVVQSFETEQLFNVALDISAQQIDTRTRYWILLLLAKNSPDLIPSFGSGFFYGVHGHDPGLKDAGYFEVL